MTLQFLAGRSESMMLVECPLRWWLAREMNARCARSRLDIDLCCDDVSHAPKTAAAVIVDVVASSKSELLSVSLAYQIKAALEAGVVGPDTEFYPSIVEFEVFAVESRELAELEHVRCSEDRQCLTPFRLNLSSELMSQGSMA